MSKEWPVAWLLWFGVISLIGALGVVVNVNRLRFSRRVARETGALLTATRSAAIRPSEPAAPLPTPADRYRMLAVGDHTDVRTVHIHHGGTFSMSVTDKPRKILGTQLFTADPPGFFWLGSIQLMPGVWVDARDISVEGRGGMRVLLDATVTLVDVHDTPDLDRGSALRLLAEMVWYPTALFDARYVTWSAIDVDHAKAVLRIANVEVSGVFEFGRDGLPVRFSAQRVHDKGELLPWGGIYRDYRRTSGLLVPFEAEVFWQLASGPFTYAHWLVDSITYDEVLSAELTARASILPNTPALAR